ncbi:DUF547 domain-containing protein [Flagellimonas alvinocaridis]|uniref:DUF547 domain-containing protein n=1 Tax=Flagellimonas alvinocaridis TaxID=2530200 RepID=A0A4S8RUT5_9FLAO|nr:DUF547 domain-containing protein [Allomuricauda alvinocaridis]THV61661.1 DUF547 domain-containing protein [Allomuricauda alvinocaridis]
MNSVLYIVLGLILICCGGKSVKIEHQETSTPPSHTLWNTLVQQYVDEDGDVDYGGLQKEVSRLDTYLGELSTNPPATSWSKNEKLAYYINLYNAGTVKLIVDHFPVESIKDIPNRWDKEWLRVGNDVLSLNDIEHKILRKMNEARIHFAINCASYSCPKLLNSAFTAENMEDQLHQAALDFINDPKRNQFEGNTAYLSKIFKWYKGDFTENGSLQEYISSYLDKPIIKDTKIDYLEYDWSLNDAK